jgi:hypothetical protein
MRLWQKIFGSAAGTTEESTIQLNGEVFDRQQVIEWLTQSGIPRANAVEVCTKLPLVQEEGTMEEANSMNELSMKRREC